MAPRINGNVIIELGNDTLLQLYNLGEDIGKKINLASANPAIVKELSELLHNLKENQ